MNDHPNHDPLPRILNIIDNIIAPMSKSDAFQWLEQLIDDLEGRRDALDEEDADFSEV